MAGFNPCVATACLLIQLPSLAKAQEIPQVSPQQSWRRMKEPTLPDWMEKDTGLRAPISLKVKGRPLRAVLSLISQKMGVQLRAARDIEEYRLSFYSDSRPLFRVMGRILDVFNHGKLAVNSCYWDRVVETGKAPRYTLRRTRIGAQQEQDILDYPRKTAMRWLREMREYGRLAPEKRREFQSDWPNLRDYAVHGTGLSDDDVAPVNEAIAGLSEQQLTELFTSGVAQLNSYSPSPQAAAQLRQAGRIDADSPLPSEATLVLEPGFTEGHYSLSLQFGKGGLHGYPTGYGLDPLGMFQTDEDLADIANAAKYEAGPDIDLTQGLDRQDNKRPVVSLPTALEMLRSAAGLNIYSETFLSDRKALAYTKGKPEYLLSRICGTFGYDWRRVGDDYIVWSKTWAQDRAADVSDDDVNRWSLARKKQGRFELRDYLEFGRLTNKQAATVSRLFGITSPFIPPNYRALRAAALLPTSTVQLAMREGGVVIGELTPLQQDALRKVFDRNEIRLPVRLRMSAQDNGISIMFTDALSEAVPRFILLGPVEGEQRGASDVGRKPP